MTGKTSSGFEYAVNENLLADYRFIRTYKKVRKGTPAEQMIAVDDLLALVIGDENVDALMDHVAEKDGSVPGEKIAAELEEIITKLGENSETKN